MNNDQEEDIRKILDEHQDAINRLREELSIVQELVELIVAHISEDDDDAPSMH
jgi:hypothetical protein